LPNQLNTAPKPLTAFETKVIPLKTNFGVDTQVTLTHKSTTLKSNTYKCQWPKSPVILEK